MAKSARKTVNVSEKKISSASTKICKKNKDDVTDVNKILLTLKSILPHSNMTSTYDIMQQTISYINDLNAVLANSDVEEDICNLQSMFVNHLNFNQQAAVFWTMWLIPLMWSEKYILYSRAHSTLMAADAGEIHRGRYDNKEAVRVLLWWCGFYEDGLMMSFMTSQRWTLIDGILSDDGFSLFLFSFYFIIQSIKRKYKFKLCFIVFFVVVTLCFCR